MSIQLRKLCHDVVQNTYKDLHALLDSIADDDIPTRHRRLLEHILLQRHRFARLLVVVRWFMSYSAFHYSAQTTREVGARRTNVMVHGADTLWAVNAVVRGAAAHPSAVQQAAEILGNTPHLHQIPKCIEASIGVDTSAAAYESSDASSSDADVPLKDAPLKEDTSQTDVEMCNDKREKTPLRKSATHLAEVEAEAVERLRAATMDLTSRALPNGVKIIKLGVEPAGAAVRVGVPGAWTADLVLDRLLLTEAFFVLLKFDIKVDSSPDAVNDIKQGHHASERSLPLTKDQQEPLRQMLVDRMRWAALNVEKGNCFDRAKKALLCLCEAMSYECCGKLAFHHIRAQCRSLVSTGMWNTQDVTFTEKEAGNETEASLHVRYWQRSSMADTVDVSVASKSAAAPTELGSVISVKSRSLPPGNDHLLNPASLDVERLLLHICGDRALEFMTNLKDDCNPILPNFATLRISRCSTSAVSLVLLLSGECPELILSISLRTGGVMAKFGGVFARLPALRSLQVKTLKEQAWEGERFFSMKGPSINEVLREIVRKAVAAYESLTREVTVTHDRSKKARYAAPPSSPSVKKKARFASDGKASASGKELESPRLSLQSKLARKRNGKHFDEEQQRFSTQSSEKKLPARPLKRFRYAGRTASSLAGVDEAAHVKAIEKIREMLTEEMRSLKVLTAPPSMAASARGKSQIPVKTTPMETESSTLHVRGNNGWALRVVLRRSVFDEVSPGGVVSFTQKTRTLNFSYPGISKTTVTCFRKDLIRARIAAALASGLSANSGMYQIQRKRPTHVSVKIGNMTLSAGLGRRSVELETYPPQPIIINQLIPLIEELLNDAGMEMGQRFGQLLDRSMPIGYAIQAIAPRDPNKFRVRFRTALRARYVIAKPNMQTRKFMTYAIDVDGRKAGRDRVMLVDVARADQLLSNNTPSSTAQQFSPIPSWEQVLNKLASKGKGTPVYNRTAVKIPMSLLATVLKVTVGVFR